MTLRAKQSVDWPREVICELLADPLGLLGNQATTTGCEEPLTMLLTGIYRQNRPQCIGSRGKVLLDVKESRKTLQHPMMVDVWAQVLMKDAAAL